MFEKNLFRAIVLIFVPYAALITAGFIVFSVFQYKYNVDLIRKNETVQLDLVSRSITRDLEAIPPDLKVLVRAPHVKDYVNKPDVKDLRQVEEELASFGRSKKQYYLIRFIDNTGKELVRIDQVNGQGHIADPSILQSLADRDYFQQALKLAPEELFISRFDLNLEPGLLGVSHRPTIRFAMPVYGRHQQVQALMVLYYDGEHLLKHFDELLSGSYGHIAFLNRDGYWIRSHHKEREWGFMQGKDIRYNQRHPVEWQQIRQADTGQIRSSDGLFTFSSVYPLELVGGYDRDHSEDQQYAKVDTHQYVWKLVSDVPESTFNQILSDYVFGVFGLIWVMLMLVGGGVSVNLAMSYLERLRLRKQNELHAKIYECSTEGIIITDPSQVIVDVNRAFTEICGYTYDELVGQRPSILSSGRHEPGFYKVLWEKLREKGYWEGEISNRHKDGSIYTEWIRISGITNPRGEVVNYIAIVSDITQRKTDEEQLIRNAHHDPLTGAHNRLSFDERLEHDLLVAKRNETHLALLYLDLDKFKPINDQYGHQVGDVVLQTVTERIEHNIRETDMLARLGGDEFAIILSQVDNEAHVLELADTLSRIIHEPCFVDGLSVSVGVSIGVAIYPEHGETAAEMLARADEAMYKVKQESRH